MKISRLPAWLPTSALAGLAFLPLVFEIGHPNLELNRTIPALNIMAPLLFAGCLLCYRPKLPGVKLVHDRETDVIISLPFALAAIWVLLIGPERMNDHYWLWRPDIQALLLFTLAAICLTFGARSAVSFLPSIVSLAITQQPLIQRLILGDNPQPALIAATAAGLAGLPLVMTRRIFCLRTFLSAVLLIVVAGGMAAVSDSLFWSAALAGTLGALVGFFTVLLIKGLPVARPKFPFVAPVPLTHRLTLVALLAGGLTLATAYSLNAAFPASAPSHVLPNVETRVAYVTPDGFTMSTSSVKGWLFTLAKAPSWAVLLDHPDDGTLHWDVASCPGVLHMSSDGIGFQVTRFQNPESFSRYARVTWYGRTSAQEVFRAGLIGWEGTLATGESLLPPVVTPDSANDVRRTLERLVRSAKLNCSINPLGIEPSLMLTAMHLAAGSSQ